MMKEERDECTETAVEHRRISEEAADPGLECCALISELRAGVCVLV